MWRKLQCIRGPAILWLMVMAASSSNYAEGILVPTELTEKLSSHLKKYQNEPYRKNRGFADPHIPVKVIVKPKSIVLPDEYKMPTQISENNTGELTFSTLTIDVLASLSDDELREFLQVLSTVPVKIKLQDKKGHAQSGKHRAHRLIPSHYDKTNAACAVILMMGAYGEKFLFADMIALAPDAVIVELYGNRVALFDSETTAQAIVKMMDEFEHHNSGAIAINATNLLRVYIKYWTHKNKKKMKYQLFNLLSAIEKKMLMDNHFDEKKVGIVLGSLMSACLHHAEKIKSIDERRIWMVNTISYIIWAGTTFLGMAPMGAQATMAAAGAISIIVGITSSFYTRYGQNRNYAPTVKEIQGYVEMSILDAHKNADQTRKLAAVASLQWMHAVIHVNGFAD